MPSVLLRYTNLSVASCQLRVVSCQLIFVSCELISVSCELISVSCELISVSCLEHYGIRGNVLSWFQSYLTGRSQYVSVNGHVSTTLPIGCGVPQGSVLGPLLFLIYVNDLASVSKVLKFYLFADDRSIYFDSNDLFTLQKVVNKGTQKSKEMVGCKQIVFKYTKN